MGMIPKLAKFPFRFLDICAVTMIADISPLQVFFGWPF